MNELVELNTHKNNIHFHTIVSKKFKTVNVIVKCKAMLNRETITKRALLPYILQQGTDKYPSEKELMMKLDELYGAVLSIDGVKKGNYHIISFRLEFANEKFINNETTVMDESLELLQEIIFSPRTEGEAFPEKIVEREKLTLKNKINSIYDDKIAYANMRLIDEMCKDELFELHTNGYVEDLDHINGEEMYTYYKSLLQKDRMDIYILGDFDEEKMSNKLFEIFNRKSTMDPKEGNEESGKVISKSNEVIETQPVQQAKLHIGYRTNTTYQDDDYFALQVFNGLFGGFPSSKLFINVREKNSLAYYASSRIESHKGLLLVFSGIEAENYEKARNIIEEQMNEMKQGNYSDSEIEEVKELIISELKETLDHPQGIIELLYQQVVGEKQISPNEFIDNIMKVTKDDIVQVAEKIDLDTIYLLTNKGGEMNE